MSRPYLDEEAVFDVARQIPTAEGRQSYLAQVCSDNTALLVRVEALLQVYDEEQDFLQASPEELGATVDAPGITERTGQHIGRYKLLQQIGEGGFGVVYMAEQQEPVRRKVALKIIKPGMDTKEVIARFEAERQALALMDHPNIAKVFDAGATETGRPFFVMELVKGIAITEYCDQSNLNSEERLEIYVTVCQAIHHAHQKGVIHRDIKPSNILITLHDGKPIVKVIDFGVAKAINQRLTERTLFTKFAQLIGTPMYMSPEQAEMSGLDVDTRTDIYSLGVVLYELLTGATPFDKKRLYEAACDEVRRIIREEEPPKPSTKISTLGDTASGICAHRKTEPKRLSALLRGDLDWIVMKALDKDRSRRYETAKDLATDVLRFLEHEPVEASPPSTVYRTRKFIRRNRGALAVTTVMAILLGSLISGAVMMFLARGESRIARAETRARNAELEIVRRDKEEAEARERELLQETEEQEWLHNIALPQLQSLTEQENWIEAFELAEAAREKFPDDTSVLQHWSEVSSTWSVTTNPPGAVVSRKPFGSTTGDWEVIGNTPLDNVPVARGMFLFQIEKQGFKSVEGLCGPDLVAINRTLDSAGEFSRMVRVECVSPSGQRIDFWIDRNEVTNAEFKQFVDVGGYGDWKYWQHPFYKDGAEIATGDVWKTFVDSSGRRGPSTWKNGTYPEGEGEFPVSGISWYEAAAYAEFRGLSLPTIYHWERAASLEQFAYIVPESNFLGQGPTPVGTCSGMGLYGTKDMAGNVKEWCSNQTTDGQSCTRGGSWNETGYMFQMVERFDPCQRGAEFGFRCAKYNTPLQPEDSADLPAESTAITPPEPPSHNEVQRLMSVFRYDSDALLNEQLIGKDANYPGCVHEIVEIDAAYGGERLALHIFWPEDVTGRQQMLVFFPGTGAIPLKRFMDGAQILDGKFVTMLAQKGRAVCWPVYKGTFERNDGYGDGITSIERLEFAKKWVKDLRRAVDYLELRPEVDMDRLGYLGFSWGANVGSLMMATEPRFKASVLVAGAYHQQSHPEIDSANYAPFATIPVLMLNGRMDKTARQNALYEMLGSTDKSREIYDSGHIMPLEQAIERIDEWLSARFGSVGKKVIASDTRADELIRIGEQAFAREQYPQAERCFRDAMEMRSRELGASHVDTLKAKSRLGAVLSSQNRDEEALLILEETWTEQEQQNGQDHDDTKSTANSLADVCQRIAWALSLRTNATMPERDRALQLAQRSVDLGVSRGWRWSTLSLAQYRKDLWSEAATTLRQSFKADNQFVHQWLIASLIASKQQDDVTARDWYAAAGEWIVKRNIQWKPILQLRSEAAKAISVPSNWPPTDRPRTERIEVYTRLIQKEPSVAQLYHCRGSHLGVLEAWADAAADYAKAAETNPGGSRHWEAFAAASLMCGDVDVYSSVCNDSFSRFPSNMDWALLMALTPDGPVASEELSSAAERILKDPAAGDNAGYNYFLRLTHGMALYRCGRFEDALVSLPESGHDNPKDEILAIVFRAMAHARLKDEYTSRELLKTARKTIESRMTPLDGPELPYQDRAVVWCMIHTIMQEAEQLVGLAAVGP